MLGVVATLKIAPGKEQEFEAVAKESVAKVNANDADCFKSLGRTMGEYMDGRAEVLRLKEVE